MLILAGLLAFYVAWNLGANDVANSMGTSVGSKAITLRQALIIAGILEFIGALWFGDRVSSTLATKITRPDLFAATPTILLAGMISVLISSGLWLNVASALSLPVSSSHAVVGAIAGFSWVVAGTQAVNWSWLGLISVSWILTPLVSGAIAALLYRLLQHWVLNHPQPLRQLDEWVPWLSVTLISVFGWIVLRPLTQHWQIAYLPAHDIPLGMGILASLLLTGWSWRQMQQVHLSSPLSSPVEQQMGRFQVLSACFVAFAHGSNDVGNAIAPLATIFYIEETGSIPIESLPVPAWLLAIGGVGIVTGLAIWGKRVMRTIGEGITALQPSGGFCAELATATTILLASRWGLPVSTSHALVGGVVGIGLVKGWHSVDFRSLRQIASAWFITIPIAAGLSALTFVILRPWFN